MVKGILISTAIILTISLSIFAMNIAIDAGLDNFLKSMRD